MSSNAADREEVASGHRSGGDAIPEVPVERVREIVERVAAEVVPGCAVDIVETDEQIVATVSGEDLALLIGRQGATIDAVQQVAARAAFRGSDERKRVMVDAGGYRERREAALTGAADHAVQEALESERPIQLEPMNAFERRVVHTHLKDRPEVETHSEGDEPDRRLVVTPAERTRD